MIEREIKERVIDGISIRYIGKLPEKKSIFFSFSKNGGKVDRIYGYISALEAILNGYDCIYIPQSDAALGIEKAFFDSKKGSLFAFVPFGLKIVKKSIISNALITNGGVVSIVEDNALFSIEALNGIKYVASLLSSAIVLSEKRCNYEPFFISDMLSIGKDVAIMKNSLEGKGMRRLVYSGLPLINSFSDFLLSPSYFLYLDKCGKYGIDGVHFSIISGNPQ